MRRVERSWQAIKVFLNGNLDFGKLSKVCLKTFRAPSTSLLESFSPFTFLPNLLKPLQTPSLLTSSNEFSLNPLKPPPTNLFAVHPVRAKLDALL